MKKPHRICVYLTPQQFVLLRRLIPWGERQKLLSNFLDDVIEKAKTSRDLLKGYSKGSVKLEWKKESEVGSE